MPLGRKFRGLVPGALRVGGGSYVLLINIALAGFVVTGFLFAYLMDRSRKQALWWIAAAGMVIVNGLIETAMPFLDNAQPFRVLSFASFQIALALLGAGIARHYRAAFPTGAAVLIFVVSVLVNILIIGMERNSLLRLFLYHSPYFVMGSISILIVLRVQKRAWLDRLFLAALTLFNLHFLLRPVSAHLLGGMGPDASGYLTSRYAAFDQTALAILGMGLVMSMALLLVRDVVSSLVEVSVTDPLSGLLNRRGFLDKAKQFVEAKRASPQPVFLVIADLDHFKNINDSYGHETGDKVIQAFGDLLGMLSSTGTSVARIGGEEFAVMFQSPNESLARLYCEKIRSAAEFGVADRNRELPKFTVSLGLAGLMPDESLESLTRRADLALYSAKQGGRNRVVLSQGGPPSAQTSLAA